ncbi:hypothetical protein V8E54_000989 [Elaphomyces granulatus]
MLIDGLEKELGEGRFRFDYNKLDEKFVAFMPSPIHHPMQGAFHDILLDMIETGFLSWTQYRGLVPYVGMLKEADYALVVDGRATPGVPSHCPILVHECGYSESSPSLLRDITKWLRGTGPDSVITAISANFYKRTNSKLAGGLKIYADGGNKIVSRLAIGDFERLQCHSTQLCKHQVNDTETTTLLLLAIIQAASYMNQTGISVATYLSLLERQENEMVQDFEDEWRYAESKNPVAVTWLISFHQIQRLNCLAAAVCASD